MLIKKILIVQANFQFMPDLGGKLNELVARKTKEILVKKGYEVTLDDITKNYNPQEEVQKIVDADCVIFQYPIWWFNTPWQFKKWIDETFMTGINVLWANDGRSSQDPSKNTVLVD